MNCPYLIFRLGKVFLFLHVSGIMREILVRGVRAESRYASAEAEAPDKNPKQRSETSYDGASIRIGFKSGHMDRVDGGYGHRPRPETVQVD